MRLGKSSFIAFWMEGHRGPNCADQLEGKSYNSPGFSSADLKAVPAEALNV